MKKLNMMIALVGVLLLAASCAKKVNVAFNTPTVVVEAAGGQMDVLLTSNGDWTVDSHPAWMTVAPESGSGDTKLTLTVQANETGLERAGEVKVSSKDNTATLTVTQEMMELYLNVSPISIACDRWGDTVEIRVTSNVVWQLNGVPDWITASTTEGTNNGTITVVIAPISEEVSQGRQADLVITGVGMEAHIAVNQSHESSLVFSVSPMELNFSNEGGTQSLSVTSNIPWTVACQAEWITINPNSGNGDGTVTVNVAENTALESREGIIQFLYSFPGGTLGSTHVMVRQEAAPDPHFLTVTPNEFSFGKEGGTADINISCDADWTTNLDSDWISLSATSGTGDANLVLTVTENIIVEPRALSFWFSSGNLVQRVSVSQEQGDEPPMVELLPDTLFVSYTGAVKTLTINSNVSWNLETNDEWILMLSTSGNGNGTRDAIIDGNQTGETRIGHIRAKHDNVVMDETIVVQETRPIIFETDITMIEARPEGGQYTINLTSTLNWHLEKGADWVTCEPVSGTGDAQIVVTVASMASLQPRATRIFIIGEFDKKVIIDVTQAY